MNPRFTDQGRYFASTQVELKELLALHSCSLKTTKQSFNAKLENNAEGKRMSNV